MVGQKMSHETIVSSVGFSLKANECHGVRYFETEFKHDPSEKETTYSLEV